MIQRPKETITLHNGVQMPPLGFGVFKIGDGNPVVNAVLSALRNGYRSIDTAAVYGNEKGVGIALSASGLPREEYFVTSKVWNSDQGYDATKRAYDESLKKLGLDYLDLYLIHWPVPNTYVETWRALLDLYKEGRVRAIGVSNFHIHHIQKVMHISDGINPMVNQIELHPLLPQKEIRNFCAQHSITVESWSPLMKGNLDLPLLEEIGKRHKKTPGQIVLRWHMQQNLVAIPKSVHEHRIRENIDIFDFALTEDEMKEIETLETGHRFGPDPDNFNF